MFFECHESEACEAFPERLPVRIQEAVTTGLKKIDISADLNPTAKAISFLKNWQKAVTAYMQCNLT